jgi:hypothetical protein
MAEPPSDRNSATLNSAPGSYKPPVVPGAAPNVNVAPNRPVSGVAEVAPNINYQELENGPPPVANKSAANIPPPVVKKAAATAPPPVAKNTAANTPLPVANKSAATAPPPASTTAAGNKITNLDNNRNETQKQAPTSSGSIGLQWVLLFALSAIPVAIWAFAPSYGNTILSAFFTTLAIVGGLLCLIAAISIMMNIYKPDGTAIMIMMGCLGAFASPLIVGWYWFYHLWVEPRPYFGLFPIGFHFENSFLDSIVAPFHDSSTDRAYEAIVTEAHDILYGGPRN